MFIFAAQFDPHLGAMPVDQRRSFFAANQCHIVTGTKQLRSQQRPVRGPKDKNFINHGKASLADHRGTVAIWLTDPCLGNKITLANQ